MPSALTTSALATTASASARDCWIPGQAASSTRPQVRYHGQAAGPQTATAISAIPRLRTMFSRRERHSSTAPSTTLSPNATTPSADSRPRAPTGTTCATVQPSAVAGVIASRTLSGVENTDVEIQPSPSPVTTLTASDHARRVEQPRLPPRSAGRLARPTRMNRIAAAAGQLDRRRQRAHRDAQQHASLDGECDAGDHQTNHQKIVVRRAPPARAARAG